MATSVSINSLSTYTDHHFIPALKDNFFLGSALWFKLREREEAVDGGDDIRFPISYDKSNVAGRWAGRFSAITLQFQDHATQGVIPVCRYTASIALADEDVAKNRGRAKLVNLIKAQVELAERSLRDKMGVDVFLDGSADSPAGFTGLAAILKYNSGTYAGISRASSSGAKNNPTGNAFWNANVVAANANTTRVFWKGSTSWDNSAVLTTAKMQTMFGSCTLDKAKPTIIVTAQVLYDKYWSLLTAIQQQYTDDTLGKFGFDSLTFNGRPVVVDDNIEAATSMYFLNLDTFVLAPYTEMNFATSPFMRAPDQAAESKLITWMGNIYCDRPQANGWITALTA